MNKPAGRAVPPESGLSKSQESYIRAEVTQQLVALKRQIDVEIADDMKQLEARLMQALRSEINSALDASERRSVANVEAVKKEIDAKVATAKNQIVLANSNQLATVQESTKQMMQSVGQQITNATYKRVINEINREIVPKVNSMVEFVSYQMQDPGEIVTDYRRAVQKQSNDSNLLTDGSAGSHIISDHVSLFFREDN